MFVDTFSKFTMNMGWATAFTITTKMREIISIRLDLIGVKILPGEVMTKYLLSKKVEATV